MNLSNVDFLIAEQKEKGNLINNINETTNDRPNFILWCSATFVISFNNTINEINEIIWYNVFRVLLLQIFIYNMRIKIIIL